MTQPKNGRRSDDVGISNTQRGSAAETLACQFLEARGLTLVSRNYRCRLGELDLIMRDAQQLVFVEVRSRASSRYGSAAETINHSKRQRLIRTATYFLQKNNYSLPCRFDVIAITQRGAALDLEWIKDAFQAD
ncbi:MAG: YraN family protein [Gammaproteobacteria bacterium]|nr:YraN family protein [Gammaproteobacteria bacterium]MCP5423756.1 YraN family protein [Gammaproteobacteria bacterium]